MCSLCIAALGGSKELCIIGNSGTLFAKVFIGSVCNVTKSDVGEELWNHSLLGGLRPRLLYKGFSFIISNYSSHHALGTLADQLVR
jgi:hypothetical protein